MKTHLCGHAYNSAYIEYAVAQFTGPNGAVRKYPPNVGPSRDLPPARCPDSVPRTKGVCISCFHPQYERVRGG